MLVSILIVIILVLCIKTMIFDLYIHDQMDDDGGNGSQNVGQFSNNLIIDPAGLRAGVGSQSIGSTLASSASLSLYYEGGDDNDEGDSEGSGNFTNRPRADPRYLEDVMNSQCQSIPMSGQTWEDLCLNSSDSGEIVGKSCGAICGINPIKGYQRSYGEARIIYNDDISDPLFNLNQLKNNAIYIPWSEAYNNIMPANPYIR